jgi:hypothetical protein
LLAEFEISVWDFLKATTSDLNSNWKSIYHPKSSIKGRRHLKGLSIEIYLAESDINRLVSLKGRGADIFS